MFRPLISLLFLIPALSTCGRAQGPISGFPAPKGETVIALSYSVDAYDNYLLAGGASEAREIETISYSLFAEVGLSDISSLVVTLPYLQTNGNEGSLQDAAAWIKYMNLDRRKERLNHRVFTAVGLSVPVARYEATGVEAIGQRASVFQGRLAYQLQHDDGWFLHGQTGLDFQFAPEARSSWPVLLRTGYGGRFIYLEAWLEFVTSLQAGTELQTATAGTGASWQRAGATAYVPLLPWVGISAGGAWVLGGEFIGQSSRYNAGVIFKISGRKEG